MLAEQTLTGPRRRQATQVDICYSESQITSLDGHSLLVRHWRPDRDRSPLGQVVIIHGYAEHGGRYRELAHRIAARGLSVSAIDLRGHGRSEGARGYVEHFDAYHNDVQAALAALPDDNTPRFILGHSNGGLVALDYVVTHEPQLKNRLHGLVVTNPFLALTRPPNVAQRFIATLAARYHPRFSLPGGISSRDISRDRQVVEAYERDPLVFGAINAAWFAAAEATQQRVRGYRRIACPLLFIYSDSDPIASPIASRDLAEQLDAPAKEIICRQGELHEVLNELDRVELHLAIAEWLVQRARSGHAEGTSAPGEREPRRVGAAPQPVNAAARREARPSRPDRRG